MRRSMPLLGVLVLMVALLLPAAPVQAAPAASDEVTYFSQTGHSVRLEFKRFFERFGGLPIFGLPLTEAFDEDGVRVQYFERARFELQPQLPDGQQVQLTQIGRWFTNERATYEQPFLWLGQNPDPTGQRTFYPESGHSLGGAFRSYWATSGGLAVFGYPISEEFGETNAAGQTYTVQYFERARFEHHPDQAGTPGEVQLGLLGRELLNQRPAAMAQTAPVPEQVTVAEPMSGLVLLGKATTGFRTSSGARESNIFKTAEMFNNVVVPAGGEYSFLNSGHFRADGLVEGYGIIGGRLEKVVGGGLCQVSTTMYRAVANAGLQVTRRVGHSYVVYFYENILGFDATVFSPGVDFRWRNDTPGPVTIRTSYDAAKSTVTFELWGVSDGRKTTFAGPFIKNKRAPGRAVWQFDPSLGRGVVSQLVHGRDGMDVNLIRTVSMPDGTIKHYNDIATRYAPWTDFYAYGPGVNPPKGVTIAAPLAPITRAAR
ncbi:MAG: VanW family protein [Roseiflexaceae bacterium]|nr:VanW family protein [Roseiflexaceae bacterium]